MHLFFKSFTYAFKGILFSLGQRNMKVLVVCAVLTIAAGFFFSISATDWCIILICIGAVIALELLNTAIESLVDLVQPTHHPLAGKVKDLAAGAVLMASIAACVCGVLVFWKYVAILLN